MIAIALAVTTVTGAWAGEQGKHDHTSQGALKERANPVKDEKLQKENVRKLDTNAAVEEREGNKIGAWAARGDAKHARKLIDKDEKKLGKRPPEKTDKAKEK